MADIIERAEFAVYDNYPSPHIRMVGELLTALKAACAELQAYTEFAEAEFERLRMEA